MNDTLMKKINILEASTMSLQNNLDEKTSTCVEHEEKVNDVDVL